MKTVGFTNDSYPEKRNIIEGNRHLLKKVKTLNTERYQRGIQRLPFIGKKVASTFYEWVPNPPEVDGIHFFNSITKKEIPFITTFESFVPRTTLLNSFDIRAENPIAGVDRKVLYPYFEILASSNCKKLIALSDINLYMQNTLLDYFPEYKEEIKKKLVQLHPPQAQLESEEVVRNKQISEIVHFVFVGRDFVRKGGREIVEVFRELKEDKNLDFRLSVVSLGNPSNYAFNEFQDDEQEIEELIEYMKNQDWVHYYKSLKFSEVLELIKSADVGLLPTWADTYGFSVLEFQACGLPVITTNIRALPEINDSDRGWLVDLETDDFNEVRVKTLNEKLKHRKQLRIGLRRTIECIVNNPSQIKEKSLKAYEYVTTVHSQEQYMEKLSAIYNEVF